MIKLISKLEKIYVTEKETDQIAVCSFWKVHKNETLPDIVLVIDIYIHVINYTSFGNLLNGVKSLDEATFVFKIIL